MKTNIALPRGASRYDTVRLLLETLAASPEHALLQQIQSKSRLQTKLKLVSPDHLVENAPVDSVRAELDFICLPGDNPKVFT